MKAPKISAEAHVVEPAADGWSVDGISRVLGGLGLLGLALITGVISYQHGLEVARMAGAIGIVAYLVPLVADLMIATSSLSILDAARNGGDKPVFAWISLAFGAAGTVVMNVAAAWGSGLWPCLLNGGVPVALILSYEALMEMIRRARKRALGDDESSQPEAAANQCPHLPAKTAEDAPVVAFLHARDCTGDRPTVRQYARDWDVNRATLSERLKKVEGPSTPVSEPEPSLNGSAAGS